jgi:hypothetical protein
MARGFYSVHGDAQTISTAITILEVAAPSTAALKILRAWVSGNTTTAGAARIRILRKSGTITGTASPPSAIPLDASATSGATIKWIATGEGTDGNVVIEEVFRLDGGTWLYLPVPEERIIVPPSGIVALKFAAAPASTAFSFGFVYEELG